MVSKKTKREAEREKKKMDRDVKRQVDQQIAVALKELKDKVKNKDAALYVLKAFVAFTMGSSTTGARDALQEPCGDGGQLLPRKKKSKKKKDIRSTRDRQ